MIDHKEIDWVVIFLVFALCFIGFFCIYSASYSKGLDFERGFVFKQLSWLGIALALFILVILVDYQKIIDMGFVLYILGLMFLLLVLFLGQVRLGAQRWFNIGGIAIQPSEFSKLIYIVMMASYLGHTRAGLSKLKGFLMPMLLTGVPFVLILLQPDLGTALVLVPVFFMMLFAAGARLRYLIGIGLCGVLVSPLFWHFLRGYQKKRLLVFLDPNKDPLGAGYTIIQSKIAIGSGGLFGKGWLAGTQNQLNFLPERHTDFIFSVVGEEWGFFGAVVLISLYFLLLKRAVMIVEKTTDIYGKLLGVGIITMLGFQVFVNIAMTIGMMPVVGIPLPLISYGGSSLWTTIIAVALLLNVGMRRTRF
ncbi:MAG: rod shape-determining protein RodA [Candidatus Omnitrophica bacterium]|nr:rod shape-determining protein RodA [Candidatus Omnitrophota bacterium]